MQMFNMICYIWIITEVIGYEWSGWYSWSPCSVTCGTGKEVRRWLCLDISLSGRSRLLEKCPGNKSLSRACTQLECPDVKTRSTAHTVLISSFTSQPRTTGNIRNISTSAPTPSPSTSKQAITTERQMTSNTIKPSSLAHTTENKSSSTESVSKLFSSKSTTTASSPRRTSVKQRTDKPFENRESPELEKIAVVTCIFMTVVILGVITIGVKSYVETGRVLQNDDGDNSRILEGY